MSTQNTELAVLRKNTEGLSNRTYAETLQKKLPNWSVKHAQTPQQEREYIQDARVATGVSIDTNLLEYAEDLELFVVVSSGYNHLPMETLTTNNVIVANAAGIHAPGIAEQALGYCLMFARSIHTGWEQKQNHEWRHYQPAELTGSTVTVVGLGAIGSEVVKRFAGMDVHTIGIRYTPEKGGPTDEVVGFDERDVHDALARTDYLVLCTPLTDTTRQLIGKAELDTLPPSAYLINVCRGGVVDTDALTAAVQKGNLSGAAIDVTDPEPLPSDHPLWRLGNVIITPHVGGHTPKHWDRLSDIVAHNARQLQSDSDLRFQNQVNDTVVNPTPSSRSVGKD